VALRHMLLDYLKPWHVEVFLFGSRARDDARPGSDIDVALWPKGPVPRGWLSGLRELVEESHILLKVDLVDLRHSDENFRSRVMREGLRWSD